MIRLILHLEIEYCVLCIFTCIISHIKAYLFSVICSQFYSSFARFIICIPGMPEDIEFQKRDADTIKEVLRKEAV